jgi:hypothetical protein
MGVQSSGGVHESESVIPFASKNAAPDNADQLDRAGQTILKLLHKAAGVAEANSKHALDMAQKLSHHVCTVIGSRLAGSERDARFVARFDDRRKRG